MLHVYLYIFQLYRVEHSCFLECTYSVSLDMKGCICHFTKWHIHPFISMEAISGESGVRVNRGVATPFSSGRLFTPPPSLVISTPFYEICLVLKGRICLLAKGYGPLMASWRYVVRCKPSLFFPLGYERVYLPLVKWHIHPFISKGTIYHYSGFSHFGQDILHRLYGVKSLPRISSFWSVFLFSCRAKIIIWHSCSFFLVNHTKACGTSPQIIKSAILLQFLLSFDPSASLHSPTWIMQTSIALFHVRSPGD